MYTGVNHLHSGLRYAVLIMLIITVVKAYSSYSKSESFGNRDDKRSLFTMIVVHIQLLLGLYLYMVSPAVQGALAQMPEAMSDKMMRFVAVEHITGMLIAIALITIGRISLKKKTSDSAKHKAIWLYYGLGLLLILISIPWPFRSLGYGWL